MMHKALLTLDEAAGLLSVSPRTVSRLLRNGEIPTVRIGRLVRVRTSDVQEWVQRQADGWGSLSGGWTDPPGSAALSTHRR
jgi:excisionase family DNA binding protein